MGGKVVQVNMLLLHLAIRVAMTTALTMQHRPPVLPHTELTDSHRRHIPFQTRMHSSMLQLLLLLPLHLLDVR